MAEDPASTSSGASPQDNDPLADLSASSAALDGVANDLSMAQESIDELLKQASFEDANAALGDKIATAGTGGDPAGGSGNIEDSSPLDADAIDALLRQANFNDPGTVGGPAAVAPTKPFELSNLQQVMHDAQTSNIDLLRDVELNVKIELGRSRMLVEDVLRLAEGSVVELDKLAGDPVDVFVNDRLVARGEVLVLNDNFCVRVNEIVAGIKEEGL